MKTLEYIYIFGGQKINSGMPIGVYQRLVKLSEDSTEMSVASIHRLSDDDVNKTGAPIKLESLQINTHPSFHPPPRDAINCVLKSVYHAEEVEKLGTGLLLVRRKDVDSVFSDDKFEQGTMQEWFCEKND